MRINKFLALSGVASRRGCDELIAKGSVLVNNQLATIGMNVSDDDIVTVNGKQVKVQKQEYFMLNKPKGYICSVRDDRGRKTVVDLLPEKVGRVFPVGRLDYDSEGLLILTTDGDLAFRLTHPSNEIPKTYLVKIEGTLKESDLNPIRSGVEINGKITKKCKAHIVETNKNYTKIHITLYEGLNREIHRMFEAIGRHVQLIKRIKIGELKLSGLDRGEFRTLTESEINYLYSI